MKDPTSTKLKYTMKDPVTFKFKSKNQTEPEAQKQSCRPGGAEDCHVCESDTPDVFAKCKINKRRL